jgi:hypothetical protein
MKVTVQTDTSDLRKRMQQYADIVGKDVNQELRRHARIACVELARYTQPFRKGKGGGKLLGEQAVEADIQKVFYTTKTDGFFNGLSKIAKRSYEARYRNSKQNNAQVRQTKFQERLRSYIDGNNYAALRRIAKDFNWKGVVDTVDPDVHQRARGGPRMKVKKRSGTMNLLLARPSELQKYITKVKARVGMAKSGWAVCAEKIPSLGQKQAATTGIPAWVTRNKSAGFPQRSRVDASTTFRKSNNPKVVMTNAVPWTSQNLSRSANRFSLQIAKDKFVKMMKIQIKYVLRNRAKLRGSR